MVDSGYTNLLAVGDRVEVSVSGDGQGAVEAVLPRYSALARPDPFYQHLKQVIVANADQLLIVVSWLEPPAWFELVDRYIIGAERNQLAPAVCINKLDLADDQGQVARAVDPYLNLGYRVLLTSAVTGRGVADLREYLGGRTTVLAGLSGVGKSTLLSAVSPGLDLRVRSVSEYWGGQGQHTTTQVRMYTLDSESHVVDTPGIREFAVAGLPPAELLDFYPEIAALSQRCRFNDCTHTHEPHCAVKTALSEGRLSATRYHNYRNILTELGG
jgi:ribosome biogenesis GTPase